MNLINKRSFTLIELLVVIAILGIIAAIGTPLVTGFINSAKESTAKNSLHSISMIEADYHADNSDYYGTPVGDQTALINQKLFNGKKTLDEKGDYKYYIQRYNSSSYRAYAIPKKSNSGLEKICVDHNNEIRLGTRC